MNRFMSRLITIGIWSVMASALTAYGQGGERLKESSSSPRQEVRRCLPGPGATGAPRDIEQLVALINSLPKPVTIPCLVESLNRPLKVLATRSTASAQSSAGPADPRIFIFSLPLIIAVTSDGPGADLVEFSVLLAGNQRSRKGELRFPISGNISSSLPYERIREESGTTCGLCHAGEARDTSISFTEAFVSRAKRASLGTEVSLDFLNRAKSECGSSANRPRCELLQALLAGGRAQRQDFPADVPSGF